MMSTAKGTNEVWCMLAGSEGCGEQDIFDGFLASVPGSASGNEFERVVSGEISQGMTSLQEHYFIWTVAQTQV